MEVTVRMYRQGLGDCFLLLFDNADKKFSILIDCGVILGTDNARPRMLDVVRDIRATVNDHLNLLICTHEHYDHLSGFLQAKEEFDQMRIDQAWLAWTENPVNPLASKLQQDRAKRISAIKKGLQLSDKRTLKTDDSKSVLEFFGDVFSLRGPNTQEALEYIRQKMGSKIEYRHPREKPVELADFPGIRFYILGPPEDEKAIKRSDPGRDKEVYEFTTINTLEESFALAVEHALLRYSDNAADRDRFNNEADPCAPFDAYYQVKRSEADHHEFFQKNYGVDTDYQDPNEWRKIGNEWLQTTGELALKLDSDTNNTSLAIAIELTDSGKVLLFPGDAQVGNWLSWHNYTWEVIEKHGDRKKITVADLLAKTILYKGGHHFSHNATLREKGLELMTHPDLTAMIPVDKAMAMKKGWAKMPFQPLLDRTIAKTKGRVIRVDTGLPDRANTTLSDQEWQAFEQACTGSNGLFINFTVKS